MPSTSSTITCRSSFQAFPDKRRRDPLAPHASRLMPRMMRSATSYAELNDSSESWPSP